jgi:hypothetical protein
MTWWWTVCRFDGLDFLTRMKGKTVMFVGDSLGRDQWESLVCLLHAAAPQSPSQLVSAEPLYTYKFMVRLHFIRVHHELASCSFGRRSKLLAPVGVRAGGVIPPRAVPGGH